MRICDKPFLLFLLMLFLQICIMSAEIYAAEKKCRCECEKAIGKIDKLEHIGKADAHLFYEDNSKKYLLENGCSLFGGEKIYSESSKLALIFPHTGCKKEENEITLWALENTSIELKKTSPGEVSSYIEKGMIHCAKAHDRVKNSKLYVETGRIHVVVIGSDFLLMETQKFTIIIINDKVTKLDVTHKKCGSKYSLRTIGEYRFTDDCEMIYQKKAEDEIKQILRELEMIPPGTGSMPELAMPDINSEQNEDSITGYTPRFPPRPAP